MPPSPATPLSPPSIPAAGPPAGIAAGTSAGFSVAGLLPADAAAAAPAVRMVHVSTTADSAADRARRRVTIRLVFK